MAASAITIVQLITGLNAGGAETMLYRTVAGMNRDRYRQVVVSLLSGTKLAPQFRALGIELYELDCNRPWKLPLALWKLVRILRKEKPDIVGAYMFHADLLGRAAAWLAKVPVFISSIRNENIGGRWRERLMAWTRRRVDATTAVCRAAGDAQVASGAVDPRTLRIIYNGVPMHRFPPVDESERKKTRHSLGIAEDRLVILTVGRLEPQKNLPMLLNSFAAIARQDPGPILAVVGEGYLQEALRRQAADLGIEARVRWLGHRPDVPELMRMADLFVLASDWEGFPNVVLEAMAASLPVIATDVGGVKEQVSPGENGWVVAPGDEAALTRALLDAVSLTPERRREMGQDGRLRVQRHFTLDRTFAELGGLYEQLVGAKGRSPSEAPRMAKAEGR